jgi:hypothetical protein
LVVPCRTPLKHRPTSGILGGLLISVSAGLPTPPTLACQGHTRCCCYCCCTCCCTPLADNGTTCTARMPTGLHKGPQPCICRLSSALHVHHSCEAQVNQSRRRVKCNQGVATPQPTDDGTKLSACCCSCPNTAWATACTCCCHPLVPSLRPSASCTEDWYMRPYCCR